MLEQEVQQAGLVDDDVRELREAVPHVLDPSETLDPDGSAGSGPQKRVSLTQ